MKTVFTFTADSITVKGKTFPAEYSVTPSGSVFVFVQEDGKQEKTRIRFNPDHAEYAAALAAARNEQPAPAADEEKTAVVPKGHSLFVVVNVHSVHLRTVFKGDDIGAVLIEL